MSKYINYILVATSALVRTVLFYLPSLAVRLTTATCDGSFLSGITPEYKYSLKLNLSGDMLSCYVEDEEQMLNILNLIDKNMDIKLDKSQINKLNQRK